MLFRSTARLLDALGRELRPDGDTDWLVARGRHHLERLLAQATITDYIPLLVYRSTKEDLLDARRAQTGRSPAELPSIADHVRPAA